jgi:hypothetical protein
MVQGRGGGRIAAASFLATIPVRTLAGMTKPTRRLSSPLLAGVTAAALVTCWLTPTPAVAAALQGASAKASVLSLEGDDPAKAVGLSKALQSEFTRRGFSGGREMSLAELKLTMGCDEPPSAACLASGGKTLGVDRMIYGTLTKTKGRATRSTSA